MATYKPVLQNYKRKDGLSLIQIRITVDRKSTYAETGIYIRPSEWNENKSEVRSLNSLHGVYNQKIIKVIEDLRKTETELSLSGMEPTAKDIKAEYTGKFSSDLCAYYSQYIEQAGAKKSRSTKDRLGFSRDKLERFIQEKRKGLTIRGLTLKIIEEFQDWLLDLPNKQTTVNKEIETLKGAINKAVTKGLIHIKNNPFNEFKYSYAEPKEKEILTPDEILLYCNAQLSGNDDLNIDIFLAQFFGAGMRVGDAISLLKTDIKGDWERLEYTTEKNKKKKRSIPINDRLKDIFLKYIHLEGAYIFPVIKSNKDIRKQIESRTSLINETLEMISPALGINKHITNHCARHSFSNIALEKTENLVKLKDALGHSDIKTTMNYVQKMKKGQNDDLIKKATNVLE